MTFWHLRPMIRGLQRTSRRVLRGIAPNMGRCDLNTLSQNLRADTLVSEDF